MAHSVCVYTHKHINTYIYICICIIYIYTYIYVYIYMHIYLPWVVVEIEGKGQEATWRGPWLVCHGTLYIQIYTYKILYIFTYIYTDIHTYIIAYMYIHTHVYLPWVVVEIEGKGQEATWRRPWLVDMARISGTGGIDCKMHLELVNTQKEFPICLYTHTHIRMYTHTHIYTRNIYMYMTYIL